MTGIYDFIEVDEPKVKPLANVPHPTKDKSVGLVGEVPQRDHKRGYVSHRRRNGPEKGFFDKGNGYCISDSVLRRLQRYDVKFVYILESDTGTVYEYNVNAFVQGTPFDEGEPQHCAPIDTAMKTWNEYADKLIVKA